MEFDYIQIFKELNESEVDYLVVGGLAVNLFGVPRLTYDIDLVIRLEADNIKRLVSKLTRWGYKPEVPVDPIEFAETSKRNLWIIEKGMKAFSFFQRSPSSRRN